ncbi:2'-5' RNA ligase family protein [Mucilaginibacter flavidus]|uniref:2'-5' RNA ligase family protein n=1 Tax=Mucilaginibacter flavidus TaxID=2949309 RepID=UPI00209209E3|nr:2'-5' RNA ligase family protein [Mucilaginibacter flavidus]MCO5947628.1 2'-5' RNA ligase family protein [Mucilaginibacter flavidus]
MNAYADYLMIISLPPGLVKEISRYKRASVNAIGHFEGMHSRAYISVTHQVRCKPFLAQPAIVRMGQRLSTMPPVELYLNGFAYFSNGRSVRTIYAKIEMNERAENWFKLLTIQMGIKLPNFVPHITVARNIPVTAFNKLWPNFENRDLKHRFIVNGLTVLHRDTFAEQSEWKIFRELHFGNKLLAF